MMMMMVPMIIAVIIIVAQGRRRQLLLALALAAPSPPLRAHGFLRLRPQLLPPTARCGLALKLPQVQLAQLMRPSEPCSRRRRLTSART